MELDRIDYRILKELQNNAQLSNKELAAIIDLAPSTCLERVRRLKSNGILQGAHAKVNPSAMGIGLQALIAIKLTRHTREIVDTFQLHILSLKEVLMVYHLAGSTDFLVHIAVCDDKHLRNLLLDFFTTRPEVYQIETSLIFEHKSRPELPNFFDTEVDKEK
ncbi:MAG: Lrp/AsnC family transcriptional regulator [Acidobacteria bacterium]|nr:Lrp/AsnC family transcriptional regulator [Acidobacteriota bacterium]